MITWEQYFGAKPHTDEQGAFATNLLFRVNMLLDEARAAGAYHDAIDPDTGSQISGSRGGAGDGGFRLPTATTGATKSAHKEARAVDVFDPQGHLDAWLTDQTLEKYGLYREAPQSTYGWTHLTTRAPSSGRRTFEV